MKYNTLQHTYDNNEAKYDKEISKNWKWII
jgi:hypothetical protein